MDVKILLSLVFFFCQKALGKYLSHSINYIGFFDFVFPKRSSSRNKGEKKPIQISLLRCLGSALRMALGLYMRECYQLTSLTFVADG